MKIVEGIPGNKINKKHNLKALAAINAKTLAREFKNGAKSAFKRPKKFKKNDQGFNQAFANLSTNELAVRRLEKKDLDPQKGYYDLKVMKEDYDSLLRN